MAAGSIRLFRIHMKCSINFKASALNQSHILTQLEEIASLPDREINLARTALLIAAADYPEMNIERELFTLQRISGDVSSALLENDDPLFCMNVLSEHLFDDLKFKGATQDYHDPRNGHLNKVLSRKRGNPITLALLYVEVGRRLNIPLAGVALPGHFLVRHHEVSDYFVDPFYRGILLSVDECRDRMKRRVRGRLNWDDKYLDTIGKRKFISRLLRSLKSSYLRRKDHDRALMMIDFSLVLDPLSAPDHRDRGIINYRLGNTIQALDDLLYYLGNAAPGSDTDGVNQLVTHIRGRMTD